MRSMSFLSRYVLPSWPIRKHVSWPCSQDIKGEWKKLGSGSFGNVYKGQFVSCLLLLTLTDTIGSYLGIDVAIKEVLPSSNYDVAKYFEREWRLMK